VRWLLGKVGRGPFRRADHLHPRLQVISDQLIES
jgi:hypothetical protein